MCKKSFRKCFWTVATLLSLCGMTSSACMLAKNLFATTPDSPIATFISVFIVVVQLCLLLIFFCFFTYSRHIEPETLQWMWYQLTSLCKAINETLHSSWVCVVPTGRYIMRWVRAGVLTEGLSQWFGSQFVRLGNQVVRIGMIMAREIEPATPPVATVTMVSTEIQTKSEVATETVAEPTSPVQQRASVVPTCSSKSAPATNTMTPTARASSTSVSTQTTTVRMPTQTRSTPSTGPIRRRTTAARTTATQTMTVSVMVRIIPHNLHPSSHCLGTLHSLTPQFALESLPFLPPPGPTLPRFILSYVIYIYCLYFFDAKPPIVGESDSLTAVSQ